jgi:DNA-binding response OmpR family regulator
MRVLVVESDPALAQFLLGMLTAEGHLPELAEDFESASRLLKETEYDVAVLDFDIQSEEPLALLRIIRAARPLAGAVVLISSRRVEDRVQTLDGGADDCITKPFSVTELCARLRALARRSQGTANAVLQVADLQMDRIERRVLRSGREIELTPKEFALLELLMCNAGAPLPRGTILQQVWDFGIASNTNVVDVYINYLRKKVDEGFGQKLIQTVRGVGYRVSGTAPAMSATN